MKTHQHFAQWLSLVECPHGLALEIYEDGNDTRQPNRVLYVTGRQWAGVKRQKPIKLKKELVKKSKSTRP